MLDFIICFKEVKVEDVERLFELFAIFNDTIEWDKSIHTRDSFLETILEFGYDIICFNMFIHLIKKYRGEDFVLTVK